MATRFKSVIALLVAVTVVTTAACASEPPAPNIEATVEARVEQERATETPEPTPNIDATIEANMVGVEIEKGVKATMAHSLITEHFNQGVTYANQGEYQLAIEDFDKAIQLAPAASHTYYGRGLAYHTLGQTAKADAFKAKSCSLERKLCD